MVRLLASNLLSDYTPIFQFRDAVCQAFYPCIVTGDQSRFSLLLDYVSKRFDDLCASLRIQVRCGLVRDDELRIVDDRPSYRDPLLLSTAQIFLKMIGSVMKPYLVNRLPRDFLCPASLIPFMFSATSTFSNAVNPLRRLNS